MLAFWLERRRQLRRLGLMQPKETELDRHVSWIRRMKDMPESEDVLRVKKFHEMDAKNRKRRQA